jgi:uncharacterized protein (TIGR04255 family)
MTTEDKAAPPSLQEVICGVVFEPTLLDAIDFGAFKESFDGEFPKHELKHALGFMEFEFNPQAALPPARVLLTSEDEQWRIQLQQDRLYVNWCRTEGAPYPGFCDPCADAVCVIERFHEVLARLRAFVSARGGQLVIERVELAKVNVLRRGREWETAAELGARFLPLGASQRLKLPGVEDGLKRFQWLMEPGSAQRWTANARFFAPEDSDDLLHVEFTSKASITEESELDKVLRELNAEVNVLYGSLIKL